ncbi:chitobiase/beta-hexosaminidase C-terminal domain-containing protein [Spiractinospora alimapuensis]|uniref:M14 family metallopeptidase n=1 Tax=Spiractinospora alimapuensis TaxID=2820884 RepID=UPI001F2D1E4E|nr:M14 family metallopeptidase [Spiractinospora alimapuensis]QVQ51136.1 chitobiase/beta-hexosaminidase C-terminal domain-containing protein [Spiractinospora alimapuensis]
MGTRIRRPRPGRTAQTGVAAVGALILVLPAAPATADPVGEPLDLDEPAVVEIPLDDRDDLDRLVDLGADIAHVEADGDGYVASTVVSPFIEDTLLDEGFEFGDVVFTEADSEARIAEREATIAGHRRENQSFGGEVTRQGGEDVLQVLRVDYFESADGNFLSVEAKSSAGPDEDFELTVRRDAGPGTEIGDGGEQSLSRFVDAGVYMYHRGMTEVEERPERVEIVSPNGGTVEGEVTEWLPDPDDPGEPLPYTDFVTSYMTPADIVERITQLAEEYPDLAEVVELPNQTNGYRRHAQAALGVELVDGTPENAERGIVVDSQDWGHEGGNDISVELLDPGAPDGELAVDVDGDTITVDLATDGDGELTSTAAEVVTALNDTAGELVEAYTFRGNDGEGIARAESATLSDNLNAPEDEVSRDPQDVLMLRIGKERDGSNMGVLAYSQEHAREWQTPLVTLETAERLLRNYGAHRRTTELVDNLDIFLVPMVNPDGANYSFNDANMQRKNLVNFCPADGPRDPVATEQGVSWGVDINRNYGAYTMWDGYAGGSSDCTSETFSGPDDEGPLSQPESRNIDWIAEEHDNIQYSMNIHSWGDYFMWSPGAYQPEDREPTPRPSLAEESYFWSASESILTAIKQHRGTVVTPARTGPIIDVLYSAAGNSGDHLWYLHDIYAWNFELGSAGFQPEWEEAHAQAMEYSYGLYDMLEVARAYDTDTTWPRSNVEPGGGRYDEPVEITFETSEPAAVYYTLDGSRPTFESDRLELSGTREGPESILIEETTTVHWFSVDLAGNIERNYDPDGNGRNYRKETFTIR